MCLPFLLWRLNANPVLVTGQIGWDCHFCRLAPAVPGLQPVCRTYALRALSLTLQPAASAHHFGMWISMETVPDRERKGWERTEKLRTRKQRKDSIILLWLMSEAVLPDWREGFHDIENENNENLEKGCEHRFKFNEKKLERCKTRKWSINIRRIWENA